MSNDLVNTPDFSALFDQQQELLTTAQDVSNAHTRSVLSAMDALTETNNFLAESARQSQQVTDDLFAELDAINQNKEEIASLPDPIANIIGLFDDDFDRDVQNQRQASLISRLEHQQQRMTSIRTVAASAAANAELNIKRSDAMLTAAMTGVQLNAQEIDTLIKEKEQLRTETLNMITDASDETIQSWVDNPKTMPLELAGKRGLLQMELRSRVSNQATLDSQLMQNELLRESMVLDRKGTDDLIGIVEGRVTDPNISVSQAREELQQRENNALALRQLQNSVEAQDIALREKALEQLGNSISFGKIEAAIAAEKQLPGSNPFKLSMAELQTVRGRVIERDRQLLGNSIEFQTKVATASADANIQGQIAERLQMYDGVVVDIEFDRSFARAGQNMAAYSGILNDPAAPLPSKMAAADALEKEVAAFQIKVDDRISRIKENIGNEAEEAMFDEWVNSPRGQVNNQSSSVNYLAEVAMPDPVIDRASPLGEVIFQLTENLHDERVSQDRGPLNFGDLEGDDNVLNINQHNRENNPIIVKNALQGLIYTTEVVDPDGRLMGVTLDGVDAAKAWFAEGLGDEARVDAVVAGFRGQALTPEFNAVAPLLQPLFSADGTEKALITSDGRIDDNKLLMQLALANNFADQRGLIPPGTSLPEIFMQEVNARALQKAQNFQPHSMTEAAVYKIALNNSGPQVWQAVGRDQIRAARQIQEQVSAELVSQTQTERVLQMSTQDKEQFVRDKVRRDAQAIQADRASRVEPPQTLLENQESMRTMLESYFGHHP